MSNPFGAPSKEWRKILDVHLSGLFYAMKHEIPPMLEAGRGSIVNMASVYGTGADLISPPSYVSSKHGIRVNVVCPGYVRTPMLDRAFDQFPGLRERVEGAQPMGRPAEPSEVADAVAWLLSDASSYVTGTC